ncbi:MAG: hypothetical protein PHG61_08125, partial [Candidatus Marinimicrobia bacterium]|nr:hypothetical protein [Candidatus Neomarinimicrobiota bacterium]
MANNVGTLSALIQKKKDELSAGVKKYFKKPPTEQDRDVKKNPDGTENLKREYEEELEYQESTYNQSSTRDDDDDSPKRDYEEELEYQESLKRKPLKSKGSVKKVGETIVKGGKSIVKSAAPVLKKAVLKLGDGV